MQTTTVPHPAKFSDSILAKIDELIFPLLDRGATILDPFAGVGKVHQLGHRYNTIGVEIEPEWASRHKRTIVGDALKLPFPDESVDAIVTSPTYGNRLADSYDGRDGSRRHSYRLDLGRMPTEGSSACMQWGDSYREFHRLAWKEATRVSKLMVVNISNHIRQGKEQPVVEWHLRTLMELGLHVVQVQPVTTPRMRHGANHKARVDSEFLLILRKP